MSFQKNAANIVTNGRSIVSATPKGGSKADIGYVAEVVAKATSVKEETTYGDYGAGYDLIIDGKLKQTRTADFQACVDARECDAFEVAGANDKASLAEVLVNYDLEKQFTGKAGSFIHFEAKIPGVEPASAKNFISSAS